MEPFVQPEIAVGLLTGGFDRPYVFGLAMALVSKGVCLDVIGSDEVDRPELHAPPKLNFLNLRGNQRPQVSLWKKVARVLIYYVRLIRYTSIAKPKIFHILWNNKFQFFDRTLLMLYYKLMGKKIAFTAHNVNAGRRDANDSALNRLSLKIQYRLADHIFIHTEKMKGELLAEFGVRKEAVTVIPFGINNSVPDTELTRAEAKRRLGIGSGLKTILFFGAIRPYKGLEHLVAAFQQIAPSHEGYRLIIAGEPRRGLEQYLRDIQETIEKDPSRGRVIQKIEYVPDHETELYFKAADVLVLPYTLVYQSGVLFLAYNFGLPVIATDVGSFRDEIVAGRTGFLCRPCDPVDLARTIEAYFESELYRSLDHRRQEIQDYANARNSWGVVGERTCKVYAGLLGR
jgi:glycosyltransferase involved in cell wall biosynthesis